MSSIFITSEVILCRLEVWLLRYKQIIIFAGFEIGCKALSVLFLEHWMLFCVDLRYDCQHAYKIFYLPALKSGLLHYPFYFYNIAGYLVSIWGTDAKIRAKCLLRRFWNRIYGITSFIFRTLEIILRLLELRLPGYEQIILFAGFEIMCTAVNVLFLQHWRLCCVD